MENLNQEVNELKLRSRDQPRIIKESLDNSEPLKDLELKLQAAIDEQQQTQELVQKQIEEIQIVMSQQLAD